MHEPEIEVLWPPLPKVTLLVDALNSTIECPNIFQFHRWKTLTVVLASVLSLNLFQYYWLYSAAKSLKKVSPNTDFPLIAFVILPSVIVTAKTLSAVGIFTEGFDRFVNLGILVVYFYYLFMLRNILNMMLGNDPSKKYWMGNLVTLFLSAMYMNYKLNRAMDAARDIQMAHQSALNSVQ